MLKQKIKIIAAAIFIIGIPLLSLAQTDVSFNPNNLIDDKVFADTQTFGGAAGIQKFLEVKNSVLANTSPNFLSQLKEPSATQLKLGLEDPEPNLGRLRTAAELIWDASVQSGLNPQVIIVTLNKEQGLITASQSLSGDSLQTALDHALGFDCPDGSGCGNLFPGFYYQLFGNFDSSGNRYIGAAKSLMRSYSAVNGRGPVVNGQLSHVGDSITIENTLGGPQTPAPSQTVTLQNKATAALYRYTPHVYNGNYNFWKYFTDWFKYPNGTLLKLASGTDVYIIQNGLKQLVPTFVAQARTLNLSNTIVVSPTEFNSFASDKILGPTDNTIVEIIGDTTKYVFLSNVKHQASDLVLKQRGLDPGKVLSVTATDLALFDQGSILPPKDGTIIKGTMNQSVYLVAAGQIKMYSGYTFAQQKIKPKQIVIVPDAEIASYAKNGFVAPQDGSLIKTANKGTVYLIQNGLRQPVLADIFKNRGLSLRNVASISEEEVNSLPLGSFATPKDKTFFAVEKGGPLFMFKEGTKHSISAFVAKQRHITADYMFTNPVAVEWLDGIPVPPTDNTVVKGENDTTVYVVMGGQLRPLTAAAFAARRITAKRIVVLPQQEVDAYAKGDLLAK